MNAPGRGREIDGIWHPSVTEVLDAVGLGVNLNGVPAEIRDAAMARGRAVHTVLEWILTGVPFDPATMAESIRPYVQAAEAFLAESGFDAVAVEKELLHPTWKFLGHPDWIGYCRKWPGEPLCLIDLKTGEADLDTAKYQLAGYALLWAAQVGAPTLRKTAIVEAHDDGSYRVLPVDAKRAEQTVLASLVVYRARREIGGVT